MSPPTETLPPEKAGRLNSAAWSLVRRSRRFGARLRPRARAAGARAWAGRLEEEKLALQALIRGTEQEFLATGEGLTRLAQQLKEIQNDCQALADLTQGREQDAAIPFAFQLLKKAEDLVLASYEQYDQVFATFRELQDDLTRLARQHRELMRVLWPLDFITLSFRIEASRHPAEVQQAFFTLAGTINGTVAEVRAALGRQFAELATGEQIARDLMAKVSVANQLHRQEVAATLARSRDRLRAWGSAITDSAAAAADLAQLNQAVTRHIGGIVMAQQCQDITRQRLEHIGEAMDEMRAHLSHARPGPIADHHEFVSRAAQIQLRQAGSVFAELNRAGSALRAGIESLRADAGTAAQAAVSVGSRALDARFARECQAGIGQILATVRDAVQKIADLLAAFAPLQASFVNCTSHATGLAGDVRRAALNAQIFAVHAPNGAPLEVLAGRVRIISDETLQQVEAMGAGLRHTAGVVNNLRQRLEDFQQLGRSEDEILTAESGRSQVKLAELEGKIPRLIRCITERQGTLAQSTEVILAKIRFPAAVAEASVRSIGFFEDLVAWSDVGDAGPGAESTAAQKIARLNAGYTMDAERQVHTTAWQPITASWAPVPATVVADGVELFGEPNAPLPVAVVLPAGDTAAEPGPAAALENPAAGQELGDNVDLF